MSEPQIIKVPIKHIDNFPQGTALDIPFVTTPDGFTEMFARDLIAYLVQAQHQNPDSLLKLSFYGTTHSWSAEPEVALNLFQYRPETPDEQKKREWKEQCDKNSSKITLAAATAAYLPLDEAKAVYAVLKKRLEP